MTSKLDYLKKYLAAPVSGAGGGCSAASETAYRDDLGGTLRKSKKEKKQLRNPGAPGKAPLENALRIRDVSEALPAQRSDREKLRKGHLAGLSLAEAPEDEVEFVDGELVAAAQKVDVDKSGVRWKISVHRKGQPATALKREDATVKREGHSGDDLSPPRPRPQVPSAATAGIAAEAARIRRTVADRDLSPPRSANGIKREEDSDLSPPRVSSREAAVKREDDSDLSPPRGAAVKCEKDADLSPPRSKPKGARPKAMKGADDDLSPPRNVAVASSTAGAGARTRARHDSDADISPPRMKAKGGARARHDSDADLSPPRVAVTGGARARHDSDADLSPPRAATKGSVRARHDSDADISPPRATTKGSARARHDSDADLSPPRAAAKESNRARHDSDASDISPPRGPASSSAAGNLNVKEEEAQEDKMSSGLRSGLVHGSVLKAEFASVREKRKAELLAQPDEETGKGAETVYRSRDLVSKITREEWASNQEKKKRKKLSDYPEQELQWGGGLKQTIDREAEQEELLRIAAQPFARFEPDEKYMEELKNKQDWNDPMNKFQAEDDNARVVASATSVAAASAAPEVKRPKCPHPPWMNRFGIKPGYRWDGKVRGTGYETRWLEQQANQERKKKEKYQWEELHSL